MVRGLIVFSFLSSLAHCQEPKYMIAYNVLHNKEIDDYEIFIMNLDGTGKKMDWKTKSLRRLTDDSITYEQAPVFVKTR